MLCSPRDQFAQKSFAKFPIDLPVEAIIEAAKRTQNMRSGFITKLASMTLCCIAFATSAAKACDVLQTEQIGEAKKQQNCKESDLQGQQDINQCSESLYVLSDQNLNRLTDRVLETLKNYTPADEGLADSRNFARAQDAWCKARDANCDFDTGVGVGVGGSMQMQIYADCRRERNEAREKALDVLEKCLEGEDCERPLLLYSYELHPSEKP